MGRLPCDRDDWSAVSIQHRPVTGTLWRPKNVRPSNNCLQLTVLYGHYRHLHARMGWHRRIYSTALLSWSHRSEQVISSRGCCWDDPRLHWLAATIGNRHPEHELPF